ncbi:MAG: PQQ-binding-like beta-propeller repeat protein [Caldilineaceae bacterium]|nr:PQQ-binding-like beta-propeller repeat protein [Caldilineaceae bacterium]
MTKRVGRRSPSPTLKPQGSRSPYSHPSDPYPYPPRDRSAEIITISLLVAAFMLLGLGGMLWVVQARLAFGPTPTPTPTRGAARTATPDYLATRVAEDFLTQQAYQMALLGTITPTPLDTEPPPPSLPDSTPDATATPVTVRLPGVNSPFTPTPSAEEATAEAAATAFALGELSPPETPTPNVVVLPMVGDNSPVSTPTSAQVAEQPPLATEPAPTETPTEIPTEIPTETPTLTVEPASPTPTETIVPPSPTPTTPSQPFVVERLQGYIRDDGTSLRLGPSNVYTATTEQLGQNAPVTIIGRNPSGEWIYVCCLANQTPYWVRQAYARPNGNPTPTGAPEGTNPNDVRWLPIQPPPAYLPALPPPVPPGPDDYPLYRYNRQGQGRVDQLPAPNLNIKWRAEAGQSLRSPVAVMGASVLVASADNELYSFHRDDGHQLWRFHLGQIVSLAPMTYQGEIFVVDQNRTVSALEDHGNGATRSWSITLEQPPLTSFNIFSDTLFIAAGEDADHILLALHRDNGAVRWRFATNGPGLRYPVIGDQLVYAADRHVTALDVINGEEVWEQTNFEDVIAGPVYASPGPSSLAELYVVAGNNRLYALDANTGIELWNRDINESERATSLALNESILLVAGNGYVKAISRQNRGDLWRAAVNGIVLGGPLIDASRILVVTESGRVEMLDAQSGSTLSGQNIPAQAGGSAAVSGPNIFVPGVDGRLYAIASE